MRQHGFSPGLSRYNSGPVIRLADAKPMQLGGTIEADSRWRIFAFADANDSGQPGGAIYRLCEFLSGSARSPLLRHTRKGEDIDALIDVRAIFQQSFRDLDIAAMPRLLRPHKGRLGLCDYEKVFCANLKNGDDIFAVRGIDRKRGCIMIIRPDQHFAHILPLTAYEDISAFFCRFSLCRAAACYAPCPPRGRRLISTTSTGGIENFAVAQTFRSPLMEQKRMIAFAGEFDTKSGHLGLESAAGTAWNGLLG